MFQLNSENRWNVSFRCRLVEEERNLLMEVRREMSGELKDVRKKLEESLKEMEILKRRALGLEDENKYLVSIPTKDRKKTPHSFHSAVFLRFFRLTSMRLFDV